ncbi:MAG: mechanosensitive ion channel family protein [Acidobacteria bacterium]|nr:mechanosensitive ion channel family protein [Acidobacteriota bacterium]
MKETLTFLADGWVRLFAPLAALALTLAAGFLAKRLLFRMLGRWASAGRSETPKILSQSLDAPFMIWVLILGLHLALDAASLPSRWNRWSDTALMVLLFLSLTMMGARLAGNLIRFYGGAVPGALRVTTLTQTLAQLAVVFLGLLALLHMLGVRIGPLLGALGVGGLAVALALQDTLSNLFAGFYVAVAGQVRVGDYIRLNTGEEGYVIDITWRTTSMRALANNLILVPNAKLAQAIVTNFHLPQKSLAANVRVNAGYASDPDQVEQVLLEEARAAASELRGLLSEPAPVARLEPGFGEFSLVYTLNFHVAEFVDQFEIQHELRKRILKRFRQEGIEIPFPTRSVYLHPSDRDGEGEKGVESE